MTEYTRSKEITEIIVSADYNSDVPLFYFMALISWESNFNPGARAANPNGSEDIGLCQLNTHSFNHPTQYLFDARNNTRLSIAILEEAYSRLFSWDKTLMIYNGGNIDVVYGGTINYYVIIIEREKAMMKEFAKRFLND